MTLKLTVLTSLLSRNAGGLFNSVRRLSQCLESECGVQTTVLGVDDEKTAEDLPAWKPLNPQVLPRFGPRSLQYAPGLLRALKVTDPDLVHVHGLWTYPSLACSRWKHASHRPHVISPRGMLDAWALRNSGWKKLIAAFAFERRHLKTASCLHALCESEAASIRKYGLTNPICVIPNGVDLPTSFRPGARSPTASHKKLLFLGRIHPKKGIAKALTAWRELKYDTRLASRTSWQFVIAGWDQGGHTSQLVAQCVELGLSYQEVSVADWLQLDHETNSHFVRTADADVVFLGPAFGEHKERLLGSADAFILPSHSEGLPMSVLEAWAFGLPVLMTPECNLPIGFETNAAIRIDHDMANAGVAQSNPSIASGLASLMEMTDAERTSMGVRGREMVERHFTWPQIAQQLKDVYDWCIGGGPLPSSVVL